MFAPKGSPNWLAWSLQFILGFVVGGVAAIIFILRAISRAFDSPLSRLSLFILGGALLGGTLASYYGDELWLGDSYRVIPPNEMQHSPASRTASKIIGAAGFALIVVFVGRNIGF